MRLAPTITCYEGIKETNINTPTKPEGKVKKDISQTGATLHAARRICLAAHIEGIYKTEKVSSEFNLAAGDLYFIRLSMGQFKGYKF